MGFIELVNVAADNYNAVNAPTTRLNTNRLSENYAQYYVTGLKNASTSEETMTAANLTHQTGKHLTQRQLTEVLFLGDL